MGQGASYAESSIQQALVRVLRKEAATELEQMRFCGIDETSMRAVAAADDEGQSSALAAQRADFGPLIEVSPAFYSIDVLREALPLLPDALWVSLHRVTVLYLLDADGDGRVSRSDVAHFTDWAIENIPEAVPSEQLAEVLHALAALHCWRRCLARVAEDHDDTTHTGRVSGHQRPSTATAPPTPALTPPSSGSPGVSAVLATMSSASPRGQAGLGGHGGLSSVTASASPRPASSSTPATTSGTSGLMDSAAMHFSLWVLRFVAQQEASRRRRRLRATRRGRLVRRAQAQSSVAAGPAPPSSTSRGPTASNSPLPQPDAAGHPAWPARTSREVEQMELDEDAVDAMLHDTPSHWMRLEKEEWFTASGVEEVYLDLGVLESSGLTFWRFCRLLDASTAAAVEHALGLTSEQAEHEVSCAAVLDELRRAVATRRLVEARQQRGAETTGGERVSEQSHTRSASTLSTPAETDTMNAASSVIVGHMEAKGLCETREGRHKHLDSEGLSSPVHHPRHPTQSDGDDQTAHRDAPVHIPDFTVSRFVLQAFVFCFVHAYWELLQSIGFDPSPATVGKAR